MSEKDDTKKFEFVEVPGFEGPTVKDDSPILQGEDLEREKGDTTNVISFPINNLGEVDVEVEEEKDGLHRPEVKVRKFAEALAEGLTPGKAAQRLGTTLKQLKSRSDMCKAIEELIDVAHVKPEIKKEVIRAGLFKTFVEGITSDDKDARKIALEASKQMATDPDIGLDRTSDVSINVNLGELEDVLKDIKIEGIKNPFKEKNNGDE